MRPPASILTILKKEVVFYFDTKKATTPKRDDHEKQRAAATEPQALKHCFLIVVLFQQGFHHSLQNPLNEPTRHDHNENAPMHWELPPSCTSQVSYACSNVQKYFTMIDIRGTI